MIVSGVFLKANEARIVTISGNKDSHTLVSPKVNKLSLPKNPTQDDVDIFSKAFKAYCTDSNLDKVIINRRPVSGQGAGGAGTFILEGILLTISPVQIHFVHQATIRATDKREINKKNMRPQTVDLGKAYDIGFEGLN